MSTSQDKSNTTNHLTQEQWKRARRAFSTLTSDVLSPEDVSVFNDTGLPPHLTQELLRARIDGGIDGLRKASKALKGDYPILDELQTPSRYKPISITELFNMPPQDWLLNGFLYEDAISVVYGSPGSAKSFITLDWAICLALGKVWMGRATKRCRVIYLAAEGVRGYQRRLRAWCYHHDIAPERIERYLSFIPCAVPLGNSAEVSDFIAALQEHLDCMSDGLPVVLMLDTIFQCTAGQNINQPEVMSGLVASVQKIREEIRATHVLLVHHSGKDKERGMFGGTALRASTDLSYCVEKDRDNNITIISDKVKDDEDIETYLFLQKVTYDTGDRDHSCVVMHRDKPVQVVKLTATQEMMLECLPDDKNGLRHTHWKTAFDERLGKESAKQTFIDNIKKLLDKGLVIERISTEASTGKGREIKAYLRKGLADTGATSNEE